VSRKLLLLTCTSEGWLLQYSEGVREEEGRREGRREGKGNGAQQLQLGSVVVWYKIFTDGGKCPEGFFF
jgi:hypothetical protein